MDPLDIRLQSALDSRKARGILRTVPDSPALLNRLPQADFSSNDYLSLATSPKLRDTVIKKIGSSTRVLGSGGSRLLDGGTLEHALLEERLANFFGSAAALLYSSGFDANVGFFGCIPAEGDVIIYDSLIHASVHDGMRASRAARRPGSLLPFDHNRIDSLHSVIENVLHTRPYLLTGNGSIFIAIESLYSMDGDIAPIESICETVEQLLPARNGHVIVDEAHATGVYGPEGKGLVAQFGLERRVTARLHTFGKALASSGAVFLTSQTVRNFLVNYSRPQVFTTAMSYSNLASLHAVFDVLQSKERCSVSLVQITQSSPIINVILDSSLNDSRDLHGSS
ncbi:PLP-dependent transferase [Serendipita vermifera]|nr:PLP-dependent transferase [Serendipita vermifera]